MKKVITILFFSLLIIGFTGCKKDKTLEELLVGKWRINTFILIAYENGVKVNELTLIYISNEEEIELLSDGTGKHYSDGVIDEVFTWSLSGNRLTVTSGIDVMEMEIAADEDTMTYKMSETYVDGLITYKREMIYTGSRI